MNKPIPTAILRNLVAASLLFASSMLLAEDPGNEKTVSVDAPSMLKDLRSSEYALHAARLEQQDYARLLDELAAAKIRLSELRPTLPLTQLQGFAADSTIPADKQQGILDEFLQAQAAFVLPLNQVALSLLEQPFARPAASNQITGILASQIYDLINKRVYTVDPNALKAKVAAGKAVPSDFPTDFAKEDFSKNLRNELVAPFNDKIGELTLAVERLNQRVTDHQRAVETKDRDLRDQVASDQLKNQNYYGLSRYGFLSMTAILLAALISLLFVARNAHLSGLLQDFFRWNPILDLSTVFILALAIIMLGLNDKLSSEVLGTLLGGIAGYVLGRASRAASAAAERAEIKNLLESKPPGDSGPSPAVGPKIESDKTVPPNL